MYTLANQAQTTSSWRFVRNKSVSIAYIGNQVLCQHCFDSKILDNPSKLGRLPN